MRNLTCPWVLTPIALALCALSGVPQRVSAQESSRVTNLEIAENADILTLDLIVSNNSIKVYVVFSNDSNSTFWVPVEVAPAYRLDVNSCMLEVWFGYSREVYGPQLAHYMLPAMRPVHPGEQFKYELNSPLLVQNLLKSHLRAKIEARVATKNFPYSRVRNNQPFDDYMKNSIVLNLETAAKCS